MKIKDTINNILWKNDLQLFYRKELGCLLRKLDWIEYYTSKYHLELGETNTCVLYMVGYGAIKLIPNTSKRASSCENMAFNIIKSYVTRTTTIED